MTSKEQNRFPAALRDGVVSAIDSAFAEHGADTTKEDVEEAVGEILLAYEWDDDTGPLYQELQDLRTELRSARADIAVLNAKTNGMEKRIKRNEDDIRRIQ